MVTIHYLLGVDLRQDIAKDDLRDSGPEVDRQVSLGIFVDVVDQRGVFQHDGAIGNDGRIDCVVLWLDLSNRVEVTGMLKIVAIPPIKIGLVGHICVWMNIRLHGFVSPPKEV